MKSVLAMLAAVLLLGGCAGQPRTDAPAPVESSRSKGPRPQSAPAPETPQADEQTVEVYAYRPPSGAPDAVPAAPQSVDTSGSVGSMVALPSESAVTSRPAGTTPLPTDARPQGSAPAGTLAMAPPPGQGLPVYSAPPPPTPALPPAAGALAAQAEQQRAAGDYIGAAATLERALRIQPQEAYLWNRLARVRMDQGRYAQAGNLAQRSNALARDQAQLKQDNWNMIAVARRTSGDAAGAMEAEARARGG